MVELRKRAAPPPAPPPAKKKAPTKPKAKKDETKTVEAQEAEAAPEATEPVAAPSKSGPPKVGDTVTLDGFGNEVETNDGTKTTLAKLVNDSKAGVVLFTYPKASTPGCRSSNNISATHFLTRIQARSRHASSANPMSH